MSEGFLVFVILNLILVGIVAHLYFYTRHKAAIVRRFAASHNYLFQSADGGTLELQLQEAFKLDGPAVRAFGQLSDIVTLPQGRLFRTVELLDLNRHAKSYNTHWSRVAVLFSRKVTCSGIYLIEPDLTVSQIFPADRDSELSEVAALFKQADLAAPPHPLSLTFMRGQGLAYLEPPVVGSVTNDDLGYLCEVVKRFST